MDAGLSGFHVAEDLDGINGAALIGINPVLTCSERETNVGIMDEISHSLTHRSSCILSSFPLQSLTALPVGVAELQVPAGAGRVLLGALGAADVLNLVVQRLESGVDLGVVLTQVSRSLVGSHVPQRIGTLVGLTKTSKGRHVDARTWRSRWTRRARSSRGTLVGEEEPVLFSDFYICTVLTHCQVSFLAYSFSAAMCERKSVLQSVLLTLFRYTFAL